jgi:iron complex outermembrane receptor protein
MSIHSRRLLLLSSSALVLLCFAGIASSQTTETPPETPPATTTPPETPATPSPAPETPAPQPSQPAPETPQAEPGTAPAVQVPQVTVAAPKPKSARRTAPAAPARTTTPAPPPPAPPPTPTPPTTPSTTTTAGQPAAPSPFQPPPSLTTLNSEQIQASQSNSLGGLFFTLPGATSAGLAPGAQRPVLRGLDDFRVRVQENGVGTMDVSDLGQDHGVPLDPLAIQKIQILRGPEALRYGSQAVGGIVEATNNRIPFAAPPGGWQTQILGATTTVDRGAEGGALIDAGSRDFAFHADVYGRKGNDYFIPSYPYLFPPDPAPSFNGKQPNSSFHSEGQSVGGSYLFDGGYVGAAVSRFSTLYHVPTLDGAATNTRIAIEQVKYTSKGEFRPQSSAIDVIRYWAGAVEYHHDEIGLGDFNIDGVQATFNNHAQEARSEIQFLPMATPLGTLISVVGGQFEHQQIDTSGDAGSLLGQARTNRAAGYFLNQLWFTDTLRLVSAGRVEPVRLDGTPGIFPASLMPPPDNPTLVQQSLDYVPKSISFKVLKDLPSWMVGSATVQRIERAPTALELFAHGAHDAPGTFDIGDPHLKIETANTAELGLQRFQGDFRFDAKIYYTYYNNFITRQATGVLCGATFATCGNGIDTEFIQTIYTQRDAIFRGTEVAWQWDLVPLASGIFGVDGQYDFVRATYAADGSNVPRMPPMRVGGGAYWRADDWFVRMGMLHVFGQYDLAVNETPTAGYNLLKLQIENTRYYRYSPWGPTLITTGLTGDNLLDVDVRNHVQFHKDEILMPGRSIKLFMNAKFGAEPAGDQAAQGYYKRSTGYGSPWFSKAPTLTAWSWAGPYLGLNLGYSAGKSKTDGVFSDATLGTPLFAAGSSDSLKGVIGGVQAGYNWQAGNWVAGLEGDIQMSGQGATPSYVCPGAICNPTVVDFDAPVTAKLVQGQKLDSFGTLRGRLGTTITPDVIAYATGGLAVGSIRTAITLSGVGLDANGNAFTFDAPFSVLKIKPGWTIGAGLEARLFGNVTGKVEYLYMDFGTVSASVTNAVNATPITFAASSHVTDNIVRAGVNYKFNPAVGGYDGPAGIGVPLIFKAPAYGAPVAIAWSWAGPYVGINVGYSAGKSKTDAVFSDPTGTPLFTTGSTDNLNGVIAGFQGGYNWMASSWLMAGIEADIQLSTQNTTPTFICPGVVCNPGIGDLATSFDRAQTLDWFGTVRGRLGATVTPETMAYLTGGLAVAEIKTAGIVAGFSPLDSSGNPNVTPVGFGFYDHRTKAGWTAGAGIETHLSGNLTGKIEYLYLDFGSVSTSTTNPLNATPVAVNLESRVSDHIVRLGLNYKFDPFATVYDPPAAAKGLTLNKPPIVTPWSWAGPYLGVNVGYGWGKSNTDTLMSDALMGTPLVANNTSAKLNGMNFGGQTGFNLQSGAWVAGIEADLQRSNQPGRTTTFNCDTATCNPAIGAFGLDAPVTARMAQKLEWFGTLRARLGVTPTPDSLLFATGGLAVGRIKTFGTISGSSLILTPGVIEGVTQTTTPGVDEDGNPIDIPVEVPFEIPTVTAGTGAANSSFISYSTKAGFAVGAGAEVRLGGNWTGKIEYLYLDFGRVFAAGTNPLNSTPLAINFDSHVTNQIARVGLNYKFDPNGAGYAPAAGSTSPMPFKAPVLAAWTWAGAYIGGTIGYSAGTSKTATVFSDPASASELFATRASRDLDGAIGGAQAGYNWVAGMWLAGIEGDLNYSGQRAKLNAVCPGEICNPALIGVIGDPSVIARFEDGQKLEWFATLRARLGVTVTPDAMAYVTGGLAVGEVMTAGTVFGFDGNGNPVNTIVSSHNTQGGWTAGGGIEGRVAGNWTAKIEYLYLDLGTVTTIPAPALGATTAVGFNSRITDNLLRVGVNYKFDPNELWVDY